MPKPKGCLRWRQVRRTFDVDQTLLDHITDGSGAAGLPDIPTATRVVVSAEAPVGIVHRRSVVLITRSEIVIGLHKRGA